MSIISEETWKSVLRRSLTIVFWLGVVAKHVLIHWSWFNITWKTKVNDGHPTWWRQFSDSIVSSESQTMYECLNASTSLDQVLLKPFRVLLSLGTRFARAIFFVLSFDTLVKESLLKFDCLWNTVHHSLSLTSWLQHQNGTFSIENPAEDTHGSPGLCFWVSYCLLNLHKKRQRCEEELKLH